MSLCGVGPLVVVLEDQTNTTLIMITLEKRLDISGFFVEGDLDEMKQFPDRMKGCYQIIVEPFDPCLKLLLTEAFEEAARPHVQVDISEVFTRSGDLIMETIRRPYAPDFPNQGEPYPGTSVKVTVFPEIKYNFDHSFARAQLSILGVDKYRDPDEDYDWDSVPDSGYNF